LAQNGFADVAEVRGDPDRLRVYEEGWQSWSPAGVYAARATSPRPADPRAQTMGFRPERQAPAGGFQGEGLLAAVAEDGSARLWTAPDPARAVPSIRARVQADRLVVAADGPVEERAAPDGLAAGLAAWATATGSAAGAPAGRRLGPGWCSWYVHWAAVSESDVGAALDAARSLELDVRLVVVDDGHQAEIGDWLRRSPRFGPLDVLAQRIRDAGCEPGLWTAPLLVGARSRLAAEHPEWLVGGALASERHWDQPIHVLDVTHPGAAEHLADTYRALRSAGFTFHKLDFLYGGALPGRRHGDAAPLDAYRHGLAIVREALGAGATLLGCGAPLLPSVGLVDAMRVSPDVDPRWEPHGADLSRPGMRAGLLAGRARAWQHGRLWTNDPDCLLARPEVERRDAWAAHLDAVGGLALSSDPLEALDAHGLALTRAALRPSDPAPLPVARLRALLSAG
jgi:alpha-galactosidase